MSDQSARDFAINNDDLTLLVEAGAGTGKTTLLVERICALIERGVKPESIAAVTFTVKAAGEMKQRLRERLNKSDSARACDALNNLDRLTVSTIHSLAAEMLRTLPVEADLPPEFTPLDQLQEQAVRDDFITNWLLQALDQPTPSAFDVAVRCGLDLLSSDDKGLASLFGTLCSAKCSLNELDAGEIDREGIANVLAEVQQHVSFLAQCAVNCIDQTDNLYETIHGLTKWHQLRPVDLNSVSAVEWLNSARTGRKGGGSQPKWSSKETLTAAKESRNNLDDLLSQLKQQLFSNACAEIVRWLVPAVNEYRRQMKQRGTIGFDDQLLLCRDMLRRSRTAREYYKSKFAHIHVDEFQDTDPSQVDILFFLAEKTKEFAGGWQDVNLEPGKLFLVGDPKQSIYRFRGADVRIYNEVAKQIEAKGKKLLITRNFRSKASILSEVNAIFVNRMSGGNEFEAKYVSLEARENAADEPNSVELLIPSPDYNCSKLNAGQAAAGEANAIADHIQRLLKQNPELNLGEVAILLRTGTKENDLLHALSARNIPFISFVNSAYTSRVETEALLTLLTAISNPQHTVAAIGSLRSPLFAISDDELFEHRFSGATFVYTDPQPDATAVGRALASLRQWHERSKHVGLAHLLEELLAVFPIEIIYGLKSDGVQRVQNLQLFVDLVRRLEESGVSSLSEIVDRISGMAKLVQATELEARDEARQSVQVLTLHKAKGLEFRYVYLFSFDEKRKSSSKWFLQDSTGNNRPMIGVKAEQSQTANLESIKKSIEHAEIAERDRLLYVGMTRARDRLILPLFWSWDKSNNRPYIPSMLAGRYQSIQAPADSSATINAVRTVGSAQSVPGFNPFATQRTLAASESDDSLTEYEDWRAKLDARVAELRSASVSSPDVEESTAMDWGRIRARKIGTYVHTVLERLAQKRIASEAEQLAGRTIALSSDELSDARQILAQVSGSDLFTTELPNAQRVITELPIVEDREDFVSAKFVDLMFQRTDGEWILLDYKTDDIPVEAVESRKEDHRRQIDGYARMFERVMGKPPVEKRLYFVRPNVTAIL